MANITSKKTIFFVTSPRSPRKLRDEIKFLVENFEGRKWNTETQKEFYIKLSQQDFFEGSPIGDVAFKARDRINRAPKALGLIDLKPVIKLTDAGKVFIYGDRPNEIFLRQLLKFQLHSPYHVDKNNSFQIKPYLELMRLVKELDGLSKHEIALFVMEMTSFNKYEDIKEKIIRFRNEKQKLRERKIGYKTFLSNEFTRTLSELFKNEIKEGNISIRENGEYSLKKFITTKKRNHIDYADAAIRYLRETGLFSLNPRTGKVYIIKEHAKDVEFVLKNVERSLFQYKNEEDYEEYLFNARTPELFSDNRDLLISKISENSQYEISSLKNKSIEDLKSLRDKLIEQKVSQVIDAEKEKLKSYSEFEDILQVFNAIEQKESIDPPLFFEWNVWRAFAMLNDGNIKGNFKIDDDGVPLYTAPANSADIVCEYKDFDTLVEVTLSSGHKQYEMEGESVARHYGNLKRISTKEKVYGIFIAPKLSDATIAHYFLLYRTNVEYYGGKAVIIPLSLEDLKILITRAHNSSHKPASSELNTLFEELAKFAETSNSEREWREMIINKIQNAFA